MNREQPDKSNDKLPRAVRFVVDNKEEKTGQLSTQMLTKKASGWRAVQPKFGTPCAAFWLVTPFAKYLKNAATHRLQHYGAAWSRNGGLE